MKLAIMQPYFFPYTGYFQLINAVDTFVIYDNIKFTKKGWIQRNRILLNNSEHLISLPIKKDSDKLNINKRYISEIFIQDKEKLKRKIVNAYKKAPFFNNVFPLINDALDFTDYNLFNFLFNSIKLVNEYLSINTEIIVSSQLPIDIEKFKSQEKVINICKSLNAKQYINPIGGIELYNKLDFEKENIKLYFLEPILKSYPQLNNQFIPWLSIIDVMMFNSKNEILDMLNKYELK